MTLLIVYLHSPFESVMPKIWPDEASMYDAWSDVLMVLEWRGSET